MFSIGIVSLFLGSSASIAVRQYDGNILFAVLFLGISIFGFVGGYMGVQNKKRRLSELSVLRADAIIAEAETRKAAIESNLSMI